MAYSTNKGFASLRRSAGTPKRPGIPRALASFGIFAGRTTHGARFLEVIIPIPHPSVFRQLSRQSAAEGDYCPFSQLARTRQRPRGSNRSLTLTLYEPALCESGNPSARRPESNDSATDTLTLALRDGPARISEEGRSGVILDCDAEDRLIAIEILDASTRVDGVDTVQLQVTRDPAPNIPRPQNSGELYQHYGHCGIVIPSALANCSGKAFKVTPAMLARVDLVSMTIAWPSGPPAGSGKVTAKIS